jgi:enamine deaminase RidA (YjgF/YER057c/UK114 family)
VTLVSHEARLTELGIQLPGPFAPHEPLLGCVLFAGVARTSGALPRDVEGTIEWHGVLGRDVPLARGVESAGLAAMNALSLLRAGLGSLDAVERVLSMTVYVACTHDFGELPSVADGASKALVDIFGDAGHHTRAAIGVAALPRGAPVEVELTVAVRTSS